MDTYENIRYLREQHGMSQEALAEKVGYRDRSSIAKIEAGLVDLSQSKIAAFASVLGVTPSQLMGLDEKPNVGKCIKHRRKQIGLSAEQVAEKLGVSPATIYRYENGEIEKVPSSILEPLAKVLQTTPAYLMGWEEAPLPENIIPLPEMKKIPLIGSIACGTPILAEENIEEYVNCPKTLKADFALTCKGDSMINARIFDGDIVYIRQQKTINSGEIAAVMVEGEATLKRVRLFQDHIVLEPENPLYKPFVYWNEEMEGIQIIGKAVAFTSSVR